MRIVFFDGVCNLCNHAVDWLIRHDDKRILKYAPLQGETAARELQNADLQLNTMVYKRDSEIFYHSTAVLMIGNDLGGIWSLARIVLWIPAPIRDAVYSWVAKNRYRLFGKRDTCRIPTPEERALFLP